MTADLGSRHWPSLDHELKRLLIVPLGATEQHGHHLPLDTDTRIAVAWADAVAPRLGDTLVAPALPYGSSGEHQAFPGTLSIGQDALRSVIIELVRSAGASFDAVALFCGHGGNAQPLTEVVEQLRIEQHEVIALFPSWSESAIGYRPDAHAGRIETSLMLHIAPGSVSLADARPGTVSPMAELLPHLVDGRLRDLSPTGVLGDPDGASAAEGEQLLADLVDRSVEALHRWRRPDVP